MTRRYRALILVACLIPLSGMPAAPAGMTVPVDVQLALFMNIWKLDRNFDSTAVVTMAVLYQHENRPSEIVKDDLMAAVDRLKLPIRCVPVEVGSPELLQKRLGQVAADVVYVTPLRAVDVAEIARISRRRGMRTLTGVPEFVDAGVAVGIGLRKSRPLIIINLEAARAEGSAFSAQLLNLARIVGPLS